MSENIELGDRAKDLVSGMNGIVTAKSFYLNGCVRYCVTPEAVDKDGKPQAGYWFDDNEIVVTKKRVATWGTAKKPIPVHGARGGDAPGR